MAASIADPSIDSRERRGSGAAVDSAMDDPFVSASDEATIPRDSHRYSTFDTQLFSLNASSPAQAKRALEAHLAETERRLEDASRLGTALVQQQKELSDKLKEIEHQQDEGEIGPELRQKLVDLEREYNEIGRESARAFLAPKRLVSGAEENGLATPSVDLKSPASPALFSGQAVNSPSKVVSVPSRKQRNQPSSRIHDIEFATEISTSLLAQVRQLQALLAEREETLKSVNLEKSRLELEAEGFSQRIRALDESEQRYKDENWSLETQTHELMAAIKEAAERENRLNSSLSAMTEDKNAVQRELEELKQVNGKLAEEQAAAQKAHDAELHLLRRNLSAGDAEKLTLQAKVDELTSQNQELAKAVAMRLRQQETDTTHMFTPIHEPEMHDQSTPENSPPVSPNKPTPRHNHLESETLRSSLGHAHRMIQNLKSNIHREKTEKIELKRMLQDARDELETRRREAQAPQAAPKRSNRFKQEAFKKPPRPEMLGHGKRRTEIEIDEPDWEDHVSEVSPTRSAASRKPNGSPVVSSTTDPSSAYQTATENDDAFETAHERETTTESDAFQTGIESMDDGETTDELTETEDRHGGSLQRRMPSALTLRQAGDRTSFQSTASTSADEDEGPYSPIQAQPQRYRLKMNRGAFRRIRPSGEAPMASESDAGSARDSPATSFQELAAPAGQSLFAELGELETPGSEGEFDLSARSRTASLASTSRFTAAYDSRRQSEVEMPPVPRPAMVDSGMMTEPWETASTAGTATEGSSTPTAPMTPQKADEPRLVNSATQWTPLRASPAPNGEHLTTVPTPPKTIWDETLPGVRREVEDGESTAPEPPAMEVSPIFAEEIVPAAPTMPSLSLSSVFTQTTEPVQVAKPEVAERETQTQSVPELIVSPVYTEQTEPSPPLSPEVPVQSVPQLSFSTIHSAETVPVQPVTPSVVVSGFSAIEEDSPVGRPATATQAKNASRNTAVLVAPDADVKEDASKEEPTQKDANLPLGDISGNAALRDMKSAPKYVNTDHGAQTILSSRQIDQLLLDREAARSVSAPPPSDQAREITSAAAAAAAATPKAKAPVSLHESVPTLQPTAKRPGSAASQRSATVNHPPLPADHRHTIAAAQKEGAQSTPGAMGPPLAPASAYKQTRPRTPNDQASQTTSNSKYTSVRTTGTRRGSQLSRRSSVSSFASELNERFNMNSDPMPANHGYGPGTDPRMIQAITQTMIGEFLWKYTRKTVGGDMSNTRHRRYFWVHPYTRTLYWSEQDPQTAGKSELKAKSVAIEAVRVIADDNPYPPGLHRKSLEVVTPGRRVKFTAATSQRHETWYNALSYLLLRSNGDDSEENDNITSDDIDEFNVNYRTTSRQTNSRLSFSSYNSRTARNTMKPRAGSAMSMRTAATPGRASPALSAPQVSTVRGPEQARSASRLSTVINTTLRGSFSSLRGRHSHVEDTYDPTVADHDSAEDLRHVIERQEREADRLENVRACCDGKHDVSALSRTSRYSPRLNRHSHHH
ncbi:hypothetical protein DTO166G4_7417 [Paecilomyces variotii]|nr:hypothetical protein DTO166G4_7417 [Paecilomyces variotii]KAJ9228079.1 hypothetical protein DTO166G5_8884 [Paecilomyces variotii]